jgi:ATP-GRASP peptide maturase of grasp-with-spasm system
MILILTCDGDMSADIVIDWLILNNHPFLRVNSHRFINCDFFFDLDNEKIELEGQIINIKEIHSVWYRKFGFFVESNFYKQAKNSVDTVNLVQLEKEYYKLLTFFTSLFKDKFWITNPFCVNINKIDVLSRAKRLGLTIPTTYILNNKKKLNDIVDEQLISKSIYDPILITTSKKNEHKHPVYMMYTSFVDKTDIDFLPETFFPSLVQKCIEKTYEIRTFYLDGEFYSMAIFSQNDTITQQDFRKYNWDKPNRTVPYNLPENIETKLNNLLIELGLNCASIDFIIDRKGNYVFLEINPTGQFGMIDFPCNYGLHKKVAEVLIKMDKQNG